MTEPPNDIVEAVENVCAIADAAVERLDRYPEEYRVPILKSMLLAATGRAPMLPIGSAGVHLRGEPGSGGSEEVDESGAGLDGLAIAAAAAGVDEADLRRIVQVTEDGFIRLLPRVDGRSTAERANRAVVVYCFIREHGFKQWDVGIEELRRLCIEQQAYNRPNFTRNFRQCPWLHEIGEHRSRDKEYRLSAQGQEAAKAVIRELLEA